MPVKKPRRLAASAAAASAKPAAKRAPRRSKRQTQPPAANQLPEYIIVNEPDAASGSRRLLFIIVSLAGVAMVVFWLWSLQQTMVTSSEDGPSWQELTHELGSQLSDLRGNLATSTNLLETSTTTDLETVKDEVLESLQALITSNAWASTTVDELKLSLEVPKDAQLTTSTHSLEKTTIFQWRLSSSATNTISIALLPNPTRSQLSVWFPNQPTMKDYGRITHATTTIGGYPAWVMTKPNSPTLLYIAFADRIYEIFTETSNQGYDVIIDRIVKSISFIKP